MPAFIVHKRSPVDRNPESGVKKDISRCLAMDTSVINPTVFLIFKI